MQLIGPSSHRQQIEIVFVITVCARDLVKLSSNTELPSDLSIAVKRLKMREESIFLGLYSW